MGCGSEWGDIDILVLPQKISAGGQKPAVTYAFAFNDCCRGTRASTWKLKGVLDIGTCKKQCTADKKCNAIEVNGCLKNKCKGKCWHFFGNEKGTLKGGNCQKNGDMKCYSKKKTTKPTKKPTNQLGGKNDAKAKNLKACIGECDADSQCAKGLKCFQRTGTQPVPGCKGKGTSGWDYCYKPNPQLGGKNDAKAKNLKACIGECDADSQCAKGLKCFQRTGTQAIPGCSGKGTSGWDYCYKPKAKPAPKLKCATGSPSNCKVTDLSSKVKGYSAGKLVRVDNGKSVKKSTEKHSCPKGFKIWSPRNKSDWTKVYNAMSKNINNYPKKPHLIVDVTRAANKCGGCTKYAMKSTTAQQGSWKTTDGSAWWLRDAKYNEPNGDYHANCYLHVYDVNPNNVRFNDGNCNYYSTSYLCQKAAKISALMLLV